MLNTQSLKLFDTYNITLFFHMHFEHKKDGTWGKKSSMEIMPTKVPSEGDDENHERDYPKRHWH